MSYRWPSEWLTPPSVIPFIPSCTPPSMWAEVVVDVLGSGLAQAAERRRLAATEAERKLMAEILGLAAA